MTRAPRERLLDIAVACEAIATYIERADVSDEIVFDAIRMRLVEIGESVKDLGADTVSREPDIPWAEIARMRDLLAHRYFDTTHAIVTTTARHDVPRLADAVRRLLAEVDESDS
ncbi:DUF86 domain-containing protein [Agromyces sp. MMS24-K17]|uniref:HepT-like ribonuclease domain-containing protein n=1 Tax=Agromyces sp. MMS24-K17 TaxID=3372850 RepID=UPI0037547B2A